MARQAGEAIAAAATKPEDLELPFARWTFNGLTAYCASDVASLPKVA